MSHKLIDFTINDPNKKTDNILGYNEKDFYFWQRYNIDMTNPLPQITVTLTKDIIIKDTKVQVNNTNNITTNMIIQFISGDNEHVAKITNINSTEKKITIDKASNNTYDNKNTTVNIYPAEIEPVKNCLLLKTNENLKKDCEKSPIDKNKQNDCYKLELCKNRENYIKIKMLEGSYSGGYDGKDANFEDISKLYNFHIVTVTNLSLGIVLLSIMIFSYF